MDARAEMTRAEILYLLEDILELKFDTGGPEAKKIASDLALAQSGIRSIEVLTVFAVGDTLLVVQPARAAAIKKILLLDPHRRKKTLIGNSSHVSRSILDR